MGGAANVLPPEARVKSIRILISNHGLNHRGGSELYVRDIAIRLKRRGRHPVAYSPSLGAVAEDLRRAGVPTIDNLRLLTEEPDVIHGHHHFDAAAAALRFPRSPGIHVCHGWVPPEESPLVLSSIRRYVAISDLTREYLVTSGAPAERIAVIPNFVDLERFATLRDPAPSVRRALVYGNQWTPDSPALAAIRAACERMGVEVEAFGLGVANPIERPERVLPGFDVVFGLGRSALEALACGCAVVLADPTGYGGLVTSDNFDRLRGANFGYGAITGRETTTQSVTAALERYDLYDVARVAQRVRSEAGIEAAVDRWESQYRLAIEEGPAPLDQLVADASLYLVKLKGMTYHFEREWHRIRHELNVSNAEFATERARSAADAAIFAAERGSLRPRGAPSQPSGRRSQRSGIELRRDGRRNEILRAHWRRIGRLLHPRLVISVRHWQACRTSLPGYEPSQRDFCGEA